MSAWRSWWRWWLASYARQTWPPASEESAREDPDELPPGIAAFILRQPPAVRGADHERLVRAALQLQRRIGNRGVRMLAEHPGEPVPSGVRNTLRPTLADDLSDVRIHTGPYASDIASAANADAVTIGGDIAFRRGAFAPDTDTGRELIRHELAHTVQAGPGAGVDPGRLEHQARRGEMPSHGVAAPGLALGQQTQSWGERVRAAHAETDARAKRAALISLVREALAGYTVHIAPESPSTGPVNPNQYAAAPAINFDVSLEQKEYWPKAGRSGRLGPRNGYFFSVSGTPYAIIGPRAIEAATPALTRMYADHELFHATHHIQGGGSSSDQELEAWTNDFTTYFHQVYQARKSWVPLIDYYERASAAARTAALTALVDYYNHQPEDIQRQILAWLRRRQGDMADKLLVRHLAARIMSRAPASGPSAPPAPPP